MKEQIVEYPNENKFFLSSVIFPKFKSNSKFPVHGFSPCLLGQSNKISTGTKKQNIVPEKGGIVSFDKYKPVYMVSADHFVVNTPGRLPTGYGQESSYYRFCGGTLYNDDSTGIIWV